MLFRSALKATTGIMYADAARVKIRSSYNVAAMSFTPQEIGNEIEKHIHGFTMTYHPDYRQQIADSWPKSIDDAYARKDWGWSHEFNLERMTDDMLAHLHQPVAG